MYVLLIALLGADVIGQVPATSPVVYDAIEELNALRASRGLAPYIRDEGLTQGAARAAVVRANNQIVGHTSNDFFYLPPGAVATAAGCAAWKPEWGFGSCCKFGNYTYAGAAWAPGRDGKRYMHLFVR